MLGEVEAMCLLGTTDPDASWLHSRLSGVLPQSPVEGALWVSRVYLVQVLGGMQVVQTFGDMVGCGGDFCCGSPARHLGSRGCSLEKNSGKG